MQTRTILLCNYVDAEDVFIRSEVHREQRGRTSSHKGADNMEP